jgi:hypothetical protein
MVALEVRASRTERVPGPLRLALDAARAEYQGRAIAARAAADAAFGAASALATYVREEHGAAPMNVAEPRQLVLFDKTAG